MKTIPVCVIGAGRIAAVHVRSILESPRASVAAVVDPDATARVALAARAGAPHFGGLEEALAAASFGAVMIASPTGTHVSYIEECVERGLTVFCEKPVDLSLERVDACVSRLPAWAPVTIGFHRRADAARREVKAAVASGQIGKPEHVFQVSRDPAPPPMSYVDHSGGMVRDMLIHDLDELVWLFGDGPVRVFASLRCAVDPDFAAHGDHDTAAITVEFANGPQCHLSASRRCAYGFEQRIEVFGSLGMIASPNSFVRQSTLADADGYHRSVLVDGFKDRFTAAYRHELEALLDMVEGKSGPLCTIAEARKSLALAYLANESHRTGSAVTADTLAYRGGVRVSADGSALGLVTPATAS
jgi:myo-inositol 2-dehydrogenase/D-chiro-inositol 1-dehydrogenase